MVLVVFFFFFFKQKTAYEMRISDWSSDVCSSDPADSAGTALATPTQGGNLLHIEQCQQHVRCFAAARRFNERSAHRSTSASSRRLVFSNLPRWLRGISSMAVIAEIR